jgi:hypothetical protein
VIEACFAELQPLVGTATACRGETTPKTTRARRFRDARPMEPSRPSDLLWQLWWAAARIRSGASGIRRPREDDRRETDHGEGLWARCVRTGHDADTRPTPRERASSGCALARLRVDRRTAFRLRSRRHSEPNGRTSTCGCVPHSSRSEGWPAGSRRCLLLRGQRVPSQEHDGTGPTPTGVYRCSSERESLGGRWSGEGEGARSPSRLGVRRRRPRRRTRVAARFPSGPRSSPRGRVRRWSSFDRSTCTCRRW